MKMPITMSTPIHTHHPHMHRRKAIDCGDHTILSNYLVKYLNCRVCLKVLTKPHRLTPCSHTFCEECITGPNCPFCLNKWEEKQPDLTAAGLVDELTVRCNAEGCPYTGSMEEYMSQHKDKCHIRRCGSLKEWQAQMKKSIHEIEEEEKMPEPNVIDVTSREENDNSNIVEVN